MKKFWISCCLLVLLAPAAAAQLPADSHNRSYVDPELDVDRMVDRFENESREVFALRSAIVAAMGIETGDVVADVGAGTGAFLDELAAAVGETGQVYAVEISIRFVERLRQRTDEAGYPNVTVVFSTFTSATLAPASVGRILLVDTYHHFDDHAAMLASMLRGLRPGGEMLVVDFDRVEDRSRQWILEHVRASSDEFRREIETAGFEFVEAVAIDGMVDNFCHRYRRP